jgi:hypothetical protein
VSVRYPPTVVRLHQLLRAHGHTDRGAADILDLYLRYGTLAASDVVILRVHHGEDRARWITARWGAAGPVAELAWQHGLGGERP